MTAKIFEFNSAVRGYHYFKKYWEPIENEELDCAHEADNPYDYFAIKICSRGSNSRTVGHLPMEISRPTKFLLLRGAKIVARLTSTSYRRSPLMQGGLEIPCSVTVFMSLTLKNKEIIKLYKDMIDAHYTEPDETAVVGSFLHHTISLPLPVNQEKRKRKQRPKECSTSKSEVSEAAHVRDIRSFFSKSPRPATFQI